MKKDTTKEDTYKLFPVLKRLIRELTAEYPAQISRTVFYTLVAGVYPVFTVLLPKIAIGILEKGGNHVETDLIKAMVIYFIIVATLGFMKNKADLKIRAVNMRSRTINLFRMYRKTMEMDYCYVEDATFWEKNSRALDAFSNNSNGMEGMLNILCRMPAKVFALVVMMVMICILNPLVLLALLLHVAVMMWISRNNHSFRYAHKEEQAKVERKMRYYEKTSQDFSFGKDIRIYNLRDRILGNYKTEIIAYKNLIQKFADHKYFISLVGIFTLLITNALMYGILIWRAYNGMSISSFTLYVNMIIMLMGNMVDFGNDIVFLQNEGQYMSDAYRLFEEKLTTDDCEQIVIPKDEAIEVVFDHVDFKYPGTDIYIYKDLNFKIHKGERLAIVGINGAGKSTLVKLMMGLFSPTAGHIYINGRDVEDFNKKDLYNIFSAVFQDVNVLAFSIRENVVGSSAAVEDEKVIEALKSVGLWDKVEGFEKGLDQMMLKVIDEEGTDFSGGERQKLSIARGLYKDAPMVVMDEPTAALDALAEAAIYESFSNMVKGKTAVYISHRLASTKFCDKIALFNKSGLVEYGTHDELMEKKGEYYRMFIIQGKYYQADDEEDEDMKRIRLDSMSGQEELA